MGVRGSTSRYRALFALQAGAQQKCSPILGHSRSVLTALSGRGIAHKGELYCSDQRLSSEFQATRW